MQSTLSHILLIIWMLLLPIFWIHCCSILLNINLRWQNVWNCGVDKANVIFVLACQIIVSRMVFQSLPRGFNYCSRFCISMDNSRNILSSYAWYARYLCWLSYFFPGSRRVLVYARRTEKPNSRVSGTVSSLLTTLSSLC